jgi:hypothetical protein
MIVASIFERLEKARPRNVEIIFARDRQLEAAQRVLDWLQRWPESTVTLKQIRLYGPGRAIRNRKSASDAATTLVRYGWLKAVKTSHLGACAWEIIRRPVAAVRPSVTMDRFIDFDKPSHHRAQLVAQ